MPKYKPRGKRVRPAFKVAPTGDAAVDMGRYRYSFTRWWGSGLRVAWVMLSPSKANAWGGARLLSRVQGFTEAWGFSSFEVVNLFAYRTPSPAHLWERRCDIVGPRNDDYLRQAIVNADRVVVAWGGAKDRRIGDRVAQVVAMMRPFGVRAYTLGANQDGSPKHPLYQKAGTKLEPWAETLTPPPLHSYSPPWLDRSS